VASSFCSLNISPYFFLLIFYKLNVSVVICLDDQPSIVVLIEQVKMGGRPFDCDVNRTSKNGWSTI